MEEIEDVGDSEGGRGVRRTFPSTLRVAGVDRSRGRVTFCAIRGPVGVVR